MLAGMMLLPLKRLGAGKRRDLGKPDMPVAITSCFGVSVTSWPSRSTTTVHSPCASSNDELLQVVDGQ